MKIKLKKSKECENCKKFLGWGWIEEGEKVVGARNYYVCKLDNLQNDVEYINKNKCPRFKPKHENKKTSRKKA